jgi:hypothetical protein
MARPLKWPRRSAIANPPRHRCRIPRSALPQKPRGALPPSCRRGRGQNFAARSIRMSAFRTSARTAISDALLPSGRAAAESRASSRARRWSGARVLRGRSCVRSFKGNGVRRAAPRRRSRDHSRRAAASLCLYELRKSEGAGPAGMAGAQSDRAVLQPRDARRLNFRGTLRRPQLP